MLHIILYAIVPIFVVMALGYFSGKKGAFSGADAKILNKVVLNYALPAALFVSIVKANRAMLSADIKLTVISFTVLLACFFLVYFVFRMYKSNTKGDAAVSALISGSPTIGFLGFAVLEPIFGTSAAVGLVIAIVSIEVNALGIPIGLCLLNSGNAQAAALNGGKKPNPWMPVVNALKQPVAWAPILAVILVLCGVKWPAELDPSFTLLAGANASVAVFAAGITLSSVKITINGQVTMGAGSTINWAQVSNQNIQSNPAYSMANQAYNLADEAYDYADTAYSRAERAYKLANSIEMPGYIKSTYIDQPTIRSPVIEGGEFYGEEFNIIAGGDFGSFNLYGPFGSSRYHMLAIEYFEGNAPLINIYSPCGGYITIGQSRNGIVYFKGVVDFSAADVQGLDLGTGA